MIKDKKMNYADKFCVSKFLIVLVLLMMLFFMTGCYGACNEDADCPSPPFDACYQGHCTKHCDADEDCDLFCDADDDDCDIEQVCIEGICAVTCSDSDDCSYADTISTWPLGCNLLKEDVSICSAACDDEGECPSGYVCIGGPGGSCTRSCENQGDCFGGTKCTGNTCLPSCFSGSDCSDGTSCKGNVCVPDCSEDSSCLSGFICIGDDSCIPSCEDPGDCGAGSTCIDSICTPFCQRSIDCPDTMSCENNICLNYCSDETPCSEGLACVDYFCIPECFPPPAVDSCVLGICDDADGDGVGICNVSKALFKTRKGHAQVSGFPPYDGVVPVPAGAGLTNDCEGNADIVLTLKDETNAHVSQYEYDFPVCLHSDISRPNVRCRFVDASVCPAGFEGVARVSNHSNAHVVPYDNLLREHLIKTFNVPLVDAWLLGEIFENWLRICCEVPQDNDGDGYAPVEIGGDDCNDDRDDINPSAPEIPDDRIDNNCNGLTDENKDSDNDGFYEPDYDECIEPESSLPTLPSYYSYMMDRTGCSLSTENGNIEPWEATGDGRAYIVHDPTAPVTDPGDSVNSMRVTGSGGVEYPIELKGNTEYTISFWYKVESGELTFSVEGSELVPETSFNDNTWEYHEATFTTPDNPDTLTEVNIKFDLGSSSIFYIDTLQLEEAPEATRFNRFTTADVGCCPYDFCYTGGAIPEHPDCIHDDYYEFNVSMPPIGWDIIEYGADGPEDSFAFIGAESGYRCIDGEWKFSTPKISPLYDGAGFCPDDSQCFLGGSHLPEIACAESDMFYKYRGAKDDQPLEYFYCYNGNWTTRTKEIALQLFNMANQSEDNTYTIFCDRYDRSLNPDQTATYYRDYVGQNVETVLTSGLVNEFCVMDLNGQIIAGVSLNQPINSVVGTDDEGCVKGAGLYCTEFECDDDGCMVPQPPPTDAMTTVDKSFIMLLKGQSDDAITYCDAAADIFDGEYHNCQAKDVYYNAKLQNVIFTKPTPAPQEVPFDEENQKTFIEEVWDFLKGALSDLLGFAGLARPVNELVLKDQLSFIENAGSFDKLYLSYSPEPRGAPRSIKAVRETRAHKTLDNRREYVTFINAEYQNYPVPICDFFYFRMPDDVRKQISDEDVDQIRCEPVILGEDSWMHSIYVEAPVFEDIPEDVQPVRVWLPGSDTFWNDITAKIRTQAPNDMGGSTPDEPEFTTSPADPISGTKMEFVITSEDDDLIARTWDFGDDKKSSSAFNVTTPHVYWESGDYPVELCVMNRDFRITCVDETVEVGLGPSVQLEDVFQTESLNKAIGLTINGGNPPFNIDIDWNDTAEHTVLEGVSEREFEDISHLYDFEVPALRKTIKVSGIDRDGVAFQNDITLVVYSEV